jgi:thiamine biosynthesis protein ThiI
MKPFEHIVIHYDEIGLKAANRGHFEKLLMTNIRAKLGDAVVDGRRESGQQTITIAPDTDRDAVCTALSRIPGIAYFSPAWQEEHDLDAIRKTALALMKAQSFKTFGVITKRRDKANDFRSAVINRDLGAAVLGICPDAGVNLTSPDVWLKIEITHTHAYVSVARINGVGGLPTNARQKVVALLSGGLDSPVAAYMMMKRGCEVIMTHYQNNLAMTDSVEDKIQQLAAQLAHFQPRTHLHIVPFGAIQNEIIKVVPAKQRMLFYRHVMLKMSARVASRNQARMLVTGDSLSQVASQTYDNLAAIYHAAELPILSPLIGLNKTEITAIARRIGTFDISSLPYDDCCSLFVPKHPELRLRLSAISDAEAKMELEPLMEAALEETQPQRLD